MNRFEHDITTLVKAQEDFYADRPNLSKHNHEIPKVSALLLDEIVELNGHTADGMTMEKYREQEIADVVWFAMAMIKQLGVYPTDESLRGIAAELGVQPPAQWSEDPTPFTPEQEGQYWDIKALLEAEAQAIQSPDFQKANSLWLLTPQERQRLLQHLHKIIGLTWSLFYLLEVNPYDAVMEKMARNHAKHQAKFYQDPSQTYESGKKEANKAWGAKANEEFYSKSPLAIVEPGERREINRAYGVISQAIASLWGATARVGSALNRNR